MAITAILFTASSSNDTIISDIYALSNYEHISDFGGFGISADAKFSHPQHISQDSYGNLYITDLGNKRIQKFDSNGTYLDQWGRSGSGDREFSEPSGIAVGQDFVYVVDRELNRVQIFDLDGNYVSQWGKRGSLSGQFYLPTGIAVGVNNTVYVADSGNHRIQAFSSNGTFLYTLGSSGTDTLEFLHLVNIHVDSHGNIYGVDRGNGKIEKFDSFGNHTTTIQFRSHGWVFSPQTIVIAPDDSMFILNSHDNRILHLDQDMHNTLRVDERLGSFNNFLSLGTDMILHKGSGHLYIVDFLNHRVYEYETPFKQIQNSSSNSKTFIPITRFDSEDTMDETSRHSNSTVTPQPITASTAKTATSTLPPTTTSTDNSSTAVSTLPIHDETTTTTTTTPTTNAKKSTHDACGQPINSYNIITGTDQNDILEGTNKADLIFALDGNDIISGYGGNDCIFGGKGDDIIFGNEGDDGIFGDQGNDIIKGSAGNDILYGNHGMDSIDGGDGNHDICITADTTNTKDQTVNCES